jgi:hypothetical protein
MRQHPLPVFLALVLLSVSCGSSSSPRQASLEEASVQPAMAPSAPREAGEAGAPATDRMIVKKVQMTLIVENAQSAAIKAEKIVTDAGGYVATSNSWKDEGAVRARLTVRVPANKLDAVLGQFRALAMEVDSESISGEDITEQYVDLQASLRNEQAYEKELLALLTETRQRTGKAADVLAVYNQLKETRGRIEQMQARSQYLEKMSALATIDLELTPSALSQPIAVGGWHPTGTIREAIRVLLRALQILVDIVIVLVIVVLPLVILVLLAFFGLRGLYRLVRRSRPQTPAPPLA